MDFVDGLGIILAVFAGGAGGSLLTIQHYRRIEEARAAYEQEAARSQNILVGLALLRRTQAEQRVRPCGQG